MTENNQIEEFKMAFLTFFCFSTWPSPPKTSYANLSNLRLAKIIRCSYNDLYLVYIINIEYIYILRI